MLAFEVSHQHRQTCTLYEQCQKLYLNNDCSESFNLLHWTGCESCASMWVEHNQIDFALHILQQVDQPALTHAKMMRKTSQMQDGSFASNSGRVSRQANTHSKGQPAGHFCAGSIDNCRSKSGLSRQSDVHTRVALLAHLLYNVD